MDEKEKILRYIQELTVRIHSLKLRVARLTGSTLKTVSGDPATFSDAIPYIALKQLKAYIEPVQDLHGQDAPYPPGGGKNKLEVTGTSKTVEGLTFNVSQDGTITVSGIYQTQVNFIINAACYLKAGDYIFNGTPTDPSWTTFQMYINVNGNKYASLSGTQFTVDADGEYPVYVSIYGPISGTLTFKPMIRLATEVDSSWAPYSNICPISGHTEVNVRVYNDSEDKSYNVPLGRTVYGGSLDVVRGVLVVDRAMVDMGSLTWYLRNELFATNLEASILKGTLISSQYKQSRATSFSSLEDMSVWNESFAYFLKNVVVKDTRYSDAASFQTAINGVQLVYELAEPQIYQLDPTTVRTILGENNIEADTGIVEVIYRAKAA